MNKTIEISLGERIQLIGAFNQVKGDIETLRAVLEDVKELTISDEEKKECGFEEVLDKNGALTSFKWNKSEPKKIELSAKSIAFFNKFVDEKSKAESLGMADLALVEIKDKLDKVDEVKEKEKVEK